MITDPNNPLDWLLLAQDRLEKADALFFQFGASWSGVELLHEAIERVKAEVTQVPEVVNFINFLQGSSRGITR